MEKKDRIYRKSHDFIEKLETKNKGLQEMIVSLTEELSMAEASMKASKERVANLEKIMVVLREDLSSAQEKSSEVDELKGEWAKLIA